MSLSVLQQNETHSSQISFGYQPNDSSILSLFIVQHNVASPTGCASSWAKIADSPDEWRGIGPFTGTTITVTSGRTPPQVDIVALEIG